MQTVVPISRRGTLAPFESWSNQRHFVGARISSRWVALLVALALWSDGIALAASAGTTLRVFAAASLADAFGEIGARFERTHPGVKVQLNLAGSQVLATQLEQGAAADVFAAADRRWMEQAHDHSLLAGESRLFARNRLVVVVPRTNPARIGRLQDLARRGI